MDGKKRGRLLSAIIERPISGEGRRGEGARKRKSGRLVNRGGKFMRNMRGQLRWIVVRLAEKRFCLSLAVGRAVVRG